jgi:hypothetical protein
MKQVIVAASVTLALTLAVGAWIGPVLIAQQQPACLHGQDESAAQQARRRVALTLTRQINTLENSSKSRGQAYQPLASVPNLRATPEGFTVHFATDGATYAFSVKDTMDPCAFAYFSDEAGVIYTGEAIR